MRRPGTRRGGGEPAAVHLDGGEGLGEGEQRAVERGTAQPRLEPGERIGQGAAVAPLAVGRDDEVEHLVDEAHGVERPRAHGHIFYIPNSSI